MKATSKTIWGVPAYLPYLQPKLTEKRILSAEKKLGFRLPKAFLDLLKVQNGGYIRFSLPDSPHRMICGIGPNFPSLLRTNLDEVQEYVSFPLKGLIPFDGDGHWHLCLDYRKNPKSPSVTYIDIECDNQKTIAKSFADYLKLLVIDTEDDYVLESVSDIAELKKAVSKALKKEFDPPDLWSYGYLVHRIALGSKRKPEWLWISPNEVPAGFVREEDARYKTLKKQMKGTALKYPFLSSNSFTLSATPAVRSRVLEIFSKLGYPPKPMKDFLKT